jgi:hypothetical protein
MRSLRCVYHPGRNAIFKKNGIFRHIAAKPSKLANLLLYVHQTEIYFGINFVHLDDDDMMIMTTIICWYKQ